MERILVDSDFIINGLVEIVLFSRRRIRKSSTGCSKNIIFSDAVSGLSNSCFEGVKLVKIM